MYVACMGARKNTFKILVGGVSGTDHLSDLVVDGKVILEWILKQLGFMEWTRSICLRTRPSCYISCILFHKRIEFFT
jgi:hypothetical protein